MTKVTSVRRLIIKIEKEEQVDIINKYVDIINGKVNSLGPSKKSKTLTNDYVGKEVIVVIGLNNNWADSYGTINECVCDIKQALTK